METKDLIRDCITLPLAISTVYNSARDMQGTGGVLRTLYALTAKSLHDLLVREYQASMRELFSRGYSIKLGSKDDERQTYIIRAKGAERPMTVSADVARVETAKIIERYMQQLERDLERQHA